MVHVMVEYQPRVFPFAAGHEEHLVSTSDKVRSLLQTVLRKGSKN
jgi:hypothetical protein